MRKYLLALILCVVYLPLTYAGSFNGIVFNNTNAQLYICVDRESGTWYGPGQSPEGNNPIMNPNTQASYTLDSSQGGALAYITVADTPNCQNPTSYCKFQLKFASFSTWQYYSNVDDQQGFQCSVPQVNNCDSCINLVINPSSSKAK